MNRSSSVRADLVIAHLALTRGLADRDALADLLRRTPQPPPLESVTDSAVDPALMTPDHLLDAGEAVGLWSAEQAIELRAQFATTRASGTLPQASAAASEALGEGFGAPLGDQDDSATQISLPLVSIGTAPAAADAGRAPRRGSQRRPSTQGSAALQASGSRGALPSTSATPAAAGSPPTTKSTKAVARSKTSRSKAGRRTARRSEAKASSGARTAHRSPRPSTRPSTKKSATQEAKAKAETRKLPSADPFVGRTLGGCEIAEKVGEGGMGAVYRARHIGLDKTVAVKILPPHIAGSPHRVERFKREAKSAAQMEHPNIVQILNVGDEGGVHYIIMQFIEGEDLRARIRRREKLPADEIVDIAVQVAKALVLAHEKGIVHRDIKPDNIMFDEEDRVKLTDFGLAKGRDQNITISNPGRAVGTPYYMSPEQCQGHEVDGRSDIYSLGATLFHAVTGIRPFEGESPLATALMHLKQPLVPPHELDPEVPRPLSQLIVRMMAKAPEARFADAGVLLAALTALESHLSGQSPIQSVQRLIGSTAPVGATDDEEVPAVARPRWPLIVFSFGALVLVVGLIAWLSTGTDTLPEPQPGPPTLAQRADAYLTRVIAEARRREQTGNLAGARWAYQTVIQRFADTPAAARAAAAVRRLDALIAKTRPDGPGPDNQPAGPSLDERALAALTEADRAANEKRDAGEYALGIEVYREYLKRWAESRHAPAARRKLQALEAEFDTKRQGVLSRLDAEATLLEAAGRFGEAVQVYQRFPPSYQNPDYEAKLRERTEALTHAAQSRYTAILAQVEPLKRRRPLAARELYREAVRMALEPMKTEAAARVAAIDAKIAERVQRLREARDARARARLAALRDFFATVVPELERRCRAGAYKQARRALAAAAEVAAGGQASLGPLVAQMSADIDELQAFAREVRARFADRKNLLATYALADGTKPRLRVLGVDATGTVRVRDVAANQTRQLTLAEFAPSTLAGLVSRPFRTSAHPAATALALLARRDEPALLAELKGEFGRELDRPRFVVRRPDDTVAVHATFFAPYRAARLALEAFVDRLAGRDDAGKLERARALYPRSGELLAIDAFLALSDSRAAEAIAAIEKLSKPYRNEVDVRLVLGNACLMEQRWEAAANAVAPFIGGSLKIAEDDPRFARLLVIDGIAQAGIGRINFARPQLERALRLDPYDPRAFEALEQLAQH